MVPERKALGAGLTRRRFIFLRARAGQLGPLPIGLAVFLAHVVCIPITGCSINPTRSFGPALVADIWEDHWLWWAGPLTGATLGALVWLVLKLIDWDGAVEAEKAIERASQRCHVSELTTRGDGILT